jgi:hypothetical protein
VGAGMALGEGPFWDCEVMRHTGTEEGENPRTTMVGRVWDEAISMGEGWWLDSTEFASEDETEDSVVVDPECSMVGRQISGVCTGGWNEDARLGRGLRVPLAWMMSTTIFSRSSEVMCLSLPRLLLLAQESCLLITGRTISNAGVSEWKSSTASSSMTESTLPESSGRSSDDRL